jgi:hypothetical protein
VTPDGYGGIEPVDGPDEASPWPEEDSAVTGARVSVTVDEQHRASLDEVVDALRGCGMEVEAVLEGLGMVTGIAPDADVLRQVEGVSSVDAELEHHLPPPDEEIQ